MKATHVFVASGESCPICSAMAGESVEPGYRPHDNCDCNTVRFEDSDETCEFDYEEDDGWRVPGGFQIHLTLTVECPDGSVHTAPGVSLFLDGLRDGSNDDLLESVAEEACADVCEEEDEEFLCC